MDQIQTFTENELKKLDCLFDIAHGNTTELLFEDKTFLQNQR